MILNLPKDKYRDLIPFLKNGILIDTCVLVDFITGFISTRYSRKVIDEYDSLIRFFDLIKVQNQWSKFNITPHIFTEICTYFKNTYDKIGNYKDLVKDIIPILNEMKDEKDIFKNEIIKEINPDRPIIEVGDISIFLATDKIKIRKEKVAILTKDGRFIEKYRDDKNVLIMDYNVIIYNMRLV